ncbi:hypothetical protein DL767_002883 [Monosporascus sp. MG133]|nr:hypothetical protein DL767_002883 [Monosporascus sp. MG133]
MAPSRATNNGGGGAKSTSFTYCVGSPTWNPKSYIADTDLHARADAHLEKDDFHSAITESFALPRRDTYVYHAVTSVTLAQVQHAVSLGAANNLHAWYRDPAAPSNPHPNPPPRSDIDVYLSVFDPATATASALKTFAANARKDSLRRRVAEHLLAKRFLHPDLPQLQIPKRKPSSAAANANPIPPNPYLAFAAWSARSLEWCGPCDLSETVAKSHHVLPVLMHHFGCVCPSYEALEILRALAAGRGVVDLGSGNGYWTFMLRAHGVGAVVPVDNAQSAWRATWVPDTVVADGEAWLRRNGGAPDMVLLIVYPVVGGGVAGGEEGGFTRTVLRAYAGDTLAVVGTQNRNGYTGFRGRTMDEYMAAEEKEWVKVVQIPLPSFPGKDEALFVFQRGDRAPKDIKTGGDAGP